MRPYDAREIARFLIEDSDENGLPINNMRLQVLLYFLQAGSFILTNTPLFYNTIEAWDHGPTVPDVYDVYKGCGFTNLPATERGGYPFDNEDLKIIHKTLDSLSDLDTWQLILLACDQAPWCSARETEDRVISPESIREWFADDNQHS